MSKDSKIDQSTKKVKFGGTEIIKFNSNDAPEKVSKINFSKAKDVRKNSNNIMSGLMETQFKENDFDSRYLRYGAKLAEENKNKSHGSIKDVELAFEKANDRKEQNWQTKISEQKNNQERTK